MAGNVEERKITQSHDLKKKKEEKKEIRKNERHEKLLIINDGHAEKTMLDIFPCHHFTFFSSLVFSTSLLSFLYLISQNMILSFLWISFS